MSLEVLEPQEKVLMRFKGMPISTILNMGFGAEWEKALAVAFLCADGYRASVPVSKLTKAKAYLAFERLAHPFTIVKEGKKVSLAPYYLVWDNKNSEFLKNTGAEIWPYQVVGMELIVAAKQ